MLSILPSLKQKMEWSVKKTKTNVNQSPFPHHSPFRVIVFSSSLSPSSSPFLMVFAQPFLSQEMSASLHLCKLRYGEQIEIESCSRETHDFRGKKKKPDREAEEGNQILRGDLGFSESLVVKALQYSKEKTRTSPSQLVPKIYSLSSVIDCGT
jgi:hypothetical protein